LNPKIAIILFLLCAIGEIGFALPYILETLWLLAGYQLAQGNLSTLDLAYLWLVAQAGRQTGSLALYYSSVLGMVPLRSFTKICRIEITQEAVHSVGYHEATK
jgi:membrane-associated protein